jgi:hypothetical protein
MYVQAGHLKVKDMLVMVIFSWRWASHITNMLFCSSKFCWFYWKQYILNYFFQNMFIGSIVTMCGLSFDVPPSSNCMGSDLTSKKFIIPCLVLCYQSCSVNSTSICLWYELLHCLPEMSRGSHVIRYSKNNVIMYITCILEFMPQKEYGPNKPSCTHNTPHTWITQFFLFH